MSPQPCDLLLSGGVLVTMAERGQVTWPGSVAVAGHEIVAVGPAKEIAERWNSAVMLDCSAQAILPGLVNCHVHAGLSLLKGRRGNTSMLEQDVLWSFVESMNEKASYVGTRLGCHQMVRSGITTFADMWPFTDANAEAVKDSGLRAVLAPCSRSYSAVELQSLASARERWNSRWLTPALGLDSIHRCSREILRAAADAARAYGLRVHMHVSEAREGTTGGRGLFEIDELGLLRHGTILADCVQVTEAEITLAAARGAGVAHNPISDAHRASGIAPLARMYRRMPVGLGTDTAGAQGRHDLFDEMRLAVLADRGCGDAALGAEEALAMATIGGARVLGLDQSIGSLEAGKCADVITVNLDDPRFIPLDRERPAQVVSHLVFSASAADVDTVIVDGRTLVRRGRALDLDQEDLMNQAQEMASVCLARAGLA